MGRFGWRRSKPDATGSSRRVQPGSGPECISRHSCATQFPPADRSGAIVVRAAESRTSPAARDSASRCAAVVHRLTAMCEPTGRSMRQITSAEATWFPAGGVAHPPMRTAAPDNNIEYFARLINFPPSDLSRRWTDDAIDRQARSVQRSRGNKKCPAARRRPGTRCGTLNQSMLSLTGLTASPVQRKSSTRPIAKIRTSIPRRYRTCDRRSPYTAGRNPPGVHRHRQSRDAASCSTGCLPRREAGSSC